MKFTKDFNPIQFKEIEGKIKGFFKSNKFQYNTNHKGNDLKPLKGSFNELDSVLGFAYTSSGIFAGYWACNGVNVFSELLPIGFNSLTGFTYALDGVLYAIFENENEESFLIKIS